MQPEPTRAPSANDRVGPKDLNPSPDYVTMRPRTRHPVLIAMVFLLAGVCVALVAEVNGLAEGLKTANERINVWSSAQARSEGDVRVAILNTTNALAQSAAKVQAFHNSVPMIVMQMRQNARGVEKLMGSSRYHEWLKDEKKEMVRSEVERLMGNP